jgi:hypothetical protein
MAELHSVPPADPRYQLWLDEGRIHAEMMLAAGATYGDSLRALRFYFGRKVLALSHGRYSVMADTLSISGHTAHRMCRLEKFTLQEPAQRQAEIWASSLAVQGAKYSEVSFVWTRALLLAAICRNQGNRGAASRDLKLHRNMLWRIPSAPGNSWPRVRATSRAQGAA